MKTPLSLVLLLIACTQAAAAPAESAYYAVALAPDRAAFTRFSLDSLGQGKLGHNPVLTEAAGTAVPGLELKEQSTYGLQGRLVWRLTRAEKMLILRSEHVAGETGLPFALTFDQRANHATLLGRMPPGERQMEMPCVLHLPDMGSARITCNAPGVKLDYEARRRVKQPFVAVSFPAATAAHPVVEYRLEVVALHPLLPGREHDASLDGFRRGYLNILQVNPRVQMLANNAASDPVTFTVFKYAEMARHLPPLAEGLTALDLVQMTLERYLGGALGYGQKGYACTPVDADLIPWPTPWTSLDSLPSLVLAASVFIAATDNQRWAMNHFTRLHAWAREMLSADSDGNGLMEYPATGNYGDRPLRTKRPSNWWDTINFGHEDAYANALIYHAASRWAEICVRLGHHAEAAWLRERAGRLRAAYVPTFLNPQTGILAGWKSIDGQLHDYWFTFVNGAAITYGLVDAPLAHAIMNRIIAKMQAVGYTDFSLGLPGNLVPIRRGDYVHSKNPPTKFGEPQLEDGSDGFQFYENGGATGCYAYFTIRALQRLGRRDDLARIFQPMLRGYAEGQFQGFGENGMSRDWRDWRGGCHGYEGLLVDNYFTLLAVVKDPEQAGR